MDLFKLFILITICSISMCAQESDVKKYRFIFQIDNRFSTIKEKEIVLLGAKIGVQYKNHFRFGLGASFISSPVNISYFNKKIKKEETNTFNLSYLSAFGDVILHKSNKWEIFITEQICFGTPRFSREINDEIVSDINKPMFLNELSGQVNYKILTWLGAGAGIGYRNIWDKSTLLHKTFDAPVYIIKVIIYPMSIFKKQTIIEN